jgi:NADPH-dependent 2,4-dienoyl-CoA reductase/sulfur reductase-like enzyme
MDRILIIGGNAAGLTAASRAKRLDPRLDVTVLERLPHISYSTCGLPYFLAKLVSAESLISYTPESFQKERGIAVHTRVRVESVIPSRKRVQGVREDTGEAVEYPFDRLLLATGVKAKPPAIPGVDLTNVFTLMNLQDAMRLREALASAKQVAIVGAGYVGLEMAECLHSLGKSVHMFEKERQVLSTVDPDMAQIIEYELRRFGVQVRTSANVLALVGENGRVNGIKVASGLGITPVEVVLLDTGVEPNVSLARESGIQTGLTGGISVDAQMETNVPGIYAAGNCAETYCAIRRRPVLSYIGTVAAKQGRTAGENMTGLLRSRFPGAIGTTILKVFDLSVARTGLTTRETEAEGIPTISARIEADDRASYYPPRRKVWVKLIAEKAGGRLIGAQIAGYGDAAKRIDVAAAAITSGMRVEDFAQLDLSYTPPYSNLWDPLLIAAQALMRGMAV